MTQRSGVTRRLGGRAFTALVASLLVCSGGLYPSPASAAVSFDPAPDVPVGAGPRGMAIADFNGDGIPDLAVTNAFPGSTRVSIRLGTGDGGFLNAPDVVAGSGPLGIVARDVNGDGHADLVVANEATFFISIRLGVGDGTFTSAPNVPVAQSPRAVGVDDFNGDGVLDFVATHGQASIASVRLGAGDGTFTSAPDVGVGVASSAVVVADFNADGMPDFATTTPGAGGVYVRLGAGDGTFTSAPTLTADVDPRGIAAADFNGDAIVDLAVANRHVGTVSIRLGVGDGTFTPAPDIAAGRGAQEIGVADFDDDGRLDLAVALQVSDTVVVLLGEGDGTFTAGVYLVVGAQPSWVAVGDLDRDGSPDLAVTLQSPDKVAIRLNRVATTTVVTSSANPSTVGSDVTFTATVAPTSGGGTVGFTVDGVAASGCDARPLVLVGDAYRATCVVSGIPAGDHAVVATYSGSGRYGASAGQLTQTVLRIPTALDAGPAVIRLLPPGVTFPGLTARLTADSPARPLAGRTVRFRVGTTEVCRATTDANGVASCRGSIVASLQTVLNLGYVAVFDGDATYLPSTDRGPLIA